MTREETIKWLESLKSEIGKSEHRSLWHYAESIDMAIEVLTESVSKGVVEQFRWERDVAMAQLEEYGIPFCTNKDEDIVEVVRCKDCRYQVHCYQTVSHTKTHDGFKEHWSEPIEFCSRGERKEP